nr:MAG TPA: hypothetical protein [Caudoviricetes sp.]
MGPGFESPAGHQREATELRVSWLFSLFSELF